jgi:hypothetical protein
MREAWGEASCFGGVAIFAEAAGPGGDDIVADDCAGTDGDTPAGRDGEALSVADGAGAAA